MIYSVRGTLIAREPNLAVVECGGVGYACRTTFETLSHLGRVGEEVQLYTYLSVREDAVELFGFASRQELSCFQLLLSVTGVGAKLAVSLLSDIHYEQFALLVAAGDSKAVTKAKGVGPKLAQRIVLELRDKLSKESLPAQKTGAVSASAAEGSIGEALAALTVLGYEQSEVLPILAALGPERSSSELIRETLRQIGKQMR